MTTVVIDAATRDKLLAAGSGWVELRDEAGKLIGKVILNTPPTPPPGYVIEGEWPSDEELDRRERDCKRYSAAEVEERLRKLKEELG
jgi:hypothetical protein